MECSAEGREFRSSMIVYLASRKGWLVSRDVRNALSRVRRRPLEQTPKFLLALLAFVPATSGTSRGLIIPGLKVSDMIVIALVIAVLGWFSLRPWRMTLIGWTLLAYGLIHLTFTLINFGRRPDLADSDLFEVGKEGVSALQYVVIFAIAMILSRDSESLGTWLKWTLSIASAMALIAFLQELGVPGIRDVLSFLTGNPRIVNWEEWEDSRATGVFFSWHALGIYLSMHATIAIALLLRARLSSRSRILIGAGLALMLLGMGAALTATPAALTGVALVALVPWRRIPRRQLVIGLGGVAIVALIGAMVFFNQIVDRVVDQGESVMPGVPRTIAYRLLFWTRDYLPLIRDNLFTGYGPLGPGDADLYPHTESMYVSVLMSGGILLLVAFLSFMIVTLLTLNGARKEFAAESVNRALALALMVITAFLLAAQIIHPYFNDAGGAPLLSVGLGVIVGQLARRSALPEEPAADPLGRAAMSGPNAPKEVN